VFAFGPSSTNGREPAFGIRGELLRLAFLTILFASHLLSALASAQATISAEYRSEANALSKIPSFIEWPDSAFASPKAPFRVCVYGNFSFGTALSELTRTDAANGRRFDIRWARKEGDLRDCQVVFISRSERKNYPKLLALLRGTTTLTIGETQDFTESGGMVEFAFENGVLTFEVNLGPVEEAHLRISSRFLSLARRVMRATESAKG
jgi:hypothetical protein